MPNIFSSGFRAKSGIREAFILLLWLCLLTAFTGGAALAQNLPATPAPAVGRASPLFSLPDSDLRPRRLTEFRGRPVTLYFFCGCPWCRRCATQWGLLQRSGSLTPLAPLAPRPVTLIVYSGSAEEARAFAAQTGLDTKQTVLLPDPTMQVTDTLYQTDPCPRVFVLNGRGTICYTNNHADDAARTAPALVIVSRALDALRHTAPSAISNKKQKHHC